MDCGSFAPPGKRAAMPTIAISRSSGAPVTPTEIEAATGAAVSSAPGPSTRYSASVEIDGYL